MEKFKGMIVFIDLQALRLKPLLTYHNILYSGVQNQTLPRAMLWESNDLIHPVLLMSAIQVYNHVLIKKTNL